MGAMTVRQEPIAIVGRGCALPGCHTVEDLWSAISDGRSLITDAPAGIWGLSPDETARTSYLGGYVTGFEAVFDPDAYDLGGIDARKLDPVFQWPLKATFDAWREAGSPKSAPDRTGVILANLSYPSRAKSDYASDLWIKGVSDIEPANVFHSGGPATLIARALGGAETAFALDAACASSLYALQIACRKLQMRALDLAFVGAVNAADNLMLHRGFEALRALSPTGRSQPFAADADGLVPAEGAVAVVLKRLCDVAPGEQVFGVIRGIGLSNDGRRRGLLAPDEAGQLEAMQAAYRLAGLSPDQIGYLECHATGTPVGDGVEIRSAKALFGARSPLPIGSLKSNIGHLITAAGLASLLKVLAAFEHRILPATLLEGAAIGELKEAELIPQRASEAWKSRFRRRAAISNFGFGGNNAHLIVEEYRRVKSARAVVAPTPAPAKPIALTAVGVLAGQDRGASRVVRRLMSPPAKPVNHCRKLVINPAFARVPPADLEAAEAQQLALLDVADEALKGAQINDTDRVGVFVGMGCSADACRWLLRERLAERLNIPAGSPKLKVLRDEIISPITAPDVLGAMPNMPANRLNAAQDFRGPGFTVSAEDKSGRTALALAEEALRAGEIDVALVGAADFASEPVRAAALEASEICVVPGDLAAMLVLKRASDLKPEETCWAQISSEDQDGPPSKVRSLLSKVYGSAPIADDLFEIAATALLARRGLIANAHGAAVWLASPSERKCYVRGGERILTFPLADASPDPLRETPVLFWSEASSRETLAKRLRAGKRGGKGGVRFAAIAADAEALTTDLQRAAATLADGEIPKGEDIWFGEGAADGDMAFVFTGSAAAYPRMGRGLFMGFPELSGKMAEAFPEARQLSDLTAKPQLSAYEQLCAVTLLSQAQTLLLRGGLGLKPDAAIGLSLGETNALIAFGFWSGAGHLLDDIAANEMYETHIGGRFETAKEAWGLSHSAEWVNWRIYAPIEAVRVAIATERNVEITIIYTQEDCVIGGPPDGCRAVAEALGGSAGQMMNQHLLVHARAMEPYADTWRALHTRPTSAQPAIRLYSNALNAAYRPTKSKVADCLTRQAVDTVDFPKTIEAAYRDGVRTFVEIGPRDTLALSVGKILGQRPHCVVAADRIERSDIAQIAALAATLFCDGRGPDMDWLHACMEAARQNAWQPPESKQSKLVKSLSHLMPGAIGSDRIDLPMAPAPDLLQPDYGSVRIPCKNSPKPCERGGNPFEPVSVVDGNTPLMPRSPSGPPFGRLEIEKATTGKISELFGPLFIEQDGYSRQVRLPAAPLLLVDRITGIEATPGKDGKGTIWTETDVADTWYIHDGFMRAGPLIEAGQADLSLISWMGADLQNKGERVYRLLGCELTVQAGGLPRPGDKLRYQIEITGHATLNGVRMFFFQYDGFVGDRRLLSVRNGQAGFFTDEELADGKGVLWDAASDPPPTAMPVAFEPSGASQKGKFSGADLAAFRQGDAYACFGDGFELCAAHSNPPRLPDGKLRLIDEVTCFDPAGGPWKRGYLKARASAPTDAWFYDGHFHNDPCMPGNLMADAAVQALEFYAAAIGLTKDRDGFVFEPVPGQAAKFVCRGQVVPDQDHELTYEVFIDEICDGETPQIYAALLARSDGKKVFFCERFGLQLRRNWPIVPADTEKHFIGPRGESRGDWAALKACGDGAPSAAFGQMYAPFDGKGRVPRLPQPPYHFISRVRSISTRPNAPVEGAEVVTEYDIPPDAWYFEDNRNGAMPFAVLVEVVLQPCGWLASHGGFALQGGECFRNLDGEGVVHQEIGPGDGTITVRSAMTKFSQVGPMTVVFFELEARLADGRLVMSLETSFGFFPRDALARQVGLKIADAHRDQLALPPLKVKTPRGKSLLPKGRMRMLDKIDYFDPQGGASGLGLARGQQSIDPYAWYFKAHFYQDPVQPGSLGLDALVQLLKRAALARGLGKGMAKPRFQSVTPGRSVKWSYRGQVTPERLRVTTTIEITRIEPFEGGCIITADGSLWCDNLRIYSADGLSIRLMDQDKCSA